MDIVTVQTRRPRGGRNRTKKPKADGSKETNGKFRNNEKSKAKGQKDGETQNAKPPVEPKRSVTLNPEQKAWFPKDNTAKVLFGNVDSRINEQLTEEEIFEKAIIESMKIATFDTRQTVPVLPNEATAKAHDKSEDEDSWGKVRRNLPTPEPSEKDKNSDSNNNSGVLQMKNLTTPAVKLNVDAYGRINGFTERHMFMGKGARMREQEYLKQLDLNPQFVNSVASETEQNSSKPQPSSSARQSQIHEPNTPNSSQESAQFPRQTAKLTEESSSFFPDRSQIRESLTSESDSIAGSSLPSAGLSQSSNVTAPETRKLSQESVQSGERSTNSSNLSRETRNYSNRDQNFQKIPNPKVVQERTTVAATRAGRPILSGANSNNDQQPKNHPISGRSVNRDFYSPNVGNGHFNKSTNDFNGSRGQKLEQSQNLQSNPHEQIHRDSGRGSTRGRGSYNKPQVDADREKRVWSDSNPHKWISKNRVVNKEAGSDQASFKNNSVVTKEAGFDQVSLKNNSVVAKEVVSDRASVNNDFVIKKNYESDQVSSKYNEEHNRNVSEQSPIQQNIQKLDEESTKIANEVNANKIISQNEIICQSSLEKLNISDPTTLEKSSDRSFDIAAEETQRKTVFVTVKYQPNPSNGDHANIPQIPEFDSKNTFNAAKENSSMEKLLEPSCSYEKSYPDVFDEATPSPRATKSTSPSLLEVDSNPDETSKPVVASCSNCDLLAPLEVRHARLRLHDPLLYDLLRWKQERDLAKSTIDDVIASNGNVNANNSDGIAKNSNEIGNNGNEIVNNGNEIVNNVNEIVNNGNEITNNINEMAMINDKTSESSAIGDWRPEDEYKHPDLEDSSYSTYYTRNECYPEEYSDSQSSSVELFGMEPNQRSISNDYEPDSTNSQASNVSYFGNSSFPNCNVASANVPINYSPQHANQNVQRHVVNVPYMNEDYQEYMQSQMYENVSSNDPRNFSGSSHQHYETPRFVPMPCGFYRPPMGQRMTNVICHERQQNGRFLNEQYRDFVAMENQSRHQLSPEINRSYRPRPNGSREDNPRRMQGQGRGRGPRYNN